MYENHYLYGVNQCKNRTKMEEIKFSVRCYDKEELARMYFPRLSHAVSVAKLRRWMRHCVPLMEELLAGDFHPKLKMFSAREVRLIVHYPRCASSSLAVMMSISRPARYMLWRAA